MNQLEHSPEYIVHICKESAWEISQTRGWYHNESLQQDGFIHCSRPDQVLRVANTFYRDEHDLVLLWIDPNLVHAEIRWESVDGDTFPHIYGPLNTDAVVSVQVLTSDVDGEYRNFRVILDD